MKLVDNAVALGVISGAEEGPWMMQTRSRATRRKVPTREHGKTVAQFQQAQENSKISKYLIITSNSAQIGYQ